MRYLLALLTLLAVANAQFGSFFDQMFGAGDQDGPHQGGGGGRRSANNPSDAAHYRQRYEQCTSPGAPCVMQSRRRCIR